MRLINKLRASVNNQQTAIILIQFKTGPISLNVKKWAFITNINTSFHLKISNSDKGLSTIETTNQLIR